jgi:hypothetical protein
MGQHPEYYTEDECLTIDTPWLKERGYFTGYRSGTITWSMLGQVTSTIGIKVKTYDFPKIEFSYTIKSPWQEERKEMNYEFQLVQIPCNLGGYRWAFKCELHANGRYCGRKCYKLFKAPNSDYFGCLKCMHVIYESQRRSGGRLEYLARILDTDKKIYDLEKSITKWTYKGKPTKKAMQHDKLTRRAIPLAEKVLLENTLLSN